MCFSLEIPHSQTQRPQLSQAGLRAGTLSIVNLIPLFAGPHLSTLADLLGISLRTIRQIHRSAGIMAVLLAGFHVIVALGTGPAPDVTRSSDLFAIIVRINFPSNPRS